MALNPSTQTNLEIKRRKDRMQTIEQTRFYLNLVLSLSADCPQINFQLGIGEGNLLSVFWVGIGWAVSGAWVGHEWAVSGPWVGSGWAARGLQVGCKLARSRPWVGCILTVSYSCKSHFIWFPSRRVGWAIKSGFCTVCFHNVIK